MNFFNAIIAAGEMVTGHSQAIADAKYLTLVTNVSKELLPLADFDINGTLVASLPVAEFHQKFVGKTVSEIENLALRDFKIMWSDVVIESGNEQAAFLPNLVVRFSSCCNETNVATITALRNKFGSSLVPLPLELTE